MFGSYEKMLIFAPSFMLLKREFEPVHAWAGTKINFVERDLRAVVRPVSKGRFRNVTVCIIKLRNFDSSCSGNATESVYVG